MDSQSVSDNKRLYSSTSPWLYNQILRLNDLLTGLGAFKKPMTDNGNVLDLIEGDPHQHTEQSLHR